MMGRRIDTHWRPWLRRALLLCGMAAATVTAAMAAPSRGEQVYSSVCVGCHQIGVLGAPKFRDETAWTQRFSKGLDTLVQHALSGFGKMPAKGGNPNLKAADLRAAIQYMAGDKVVAAASKGRTGSAPPAGGAKPEAVAVASPERGAEVVHRVCKGCHEVGVLGAPKLGNAKDWKPRLAKGEDALVQSALKGIGNMPPKGGHPSLTEAELRAAIRYMSSPEAAKRPAVAAKRPPDRTRAGAAPVPAALQPNNANRFNRLLRPRSERNRPPMKDGIHDPANEGTRILQPPKQAFQSLPDGHGGNYVDWVEALKENKIAPRWDLKDPAKQPLVMDLNIVREVKGSMPNVVYPHKQHLQWLDCSNCHPAIFIPQKGANTISMAEILLGRKCGVCHGKVAFPVSECRRCHSQKKPSLALDGPRDSTEAALGRKP